MACGSNNILPNGMACLQRMQIPKSSSSNRLNATFRLFNFSSAFLSAASFTDLLLMASILDTLPMAFSGAIGRVSSLYLVTNSRVDWISSSMRTRIWSLSITGKVKEKGYDSVAFFCFLIFILSSSDFSSKSMVIASPSLRFELIISSANASSIYF